MKTVVELGIELEAVRAEESRLSSARYALILAIEEAEGRPDSSDARFARAVLANDEAGMTAARIAGLSSFRARYGHFPEEPLYRRCVVVEHAAGIPVAVDAGEVSP